MNQNRCALCNEIVPSGVGVYLNDKIYCNQRHAENILSEQHIVKVKNIME